MIAFSCVHCGKRMKVTEDDGAKRATCSACGHSVLLPSDTGTRTSRGDQPSTGKTACQVGQTSVARSPRREPPPADLSPEPIHDLPTRVAGYEEPGASLTALLAPPQQPDEIGRLGPYRVLEVIGAGGMGVVYKAHDPQLDRLVALKAILPAFASNVTVRERFQREARTAARLQHDRIVSVYQVGEDRGVPFLAMPLLRGESLERYLAARPRGAAVPEIVRIAEETAEGLAAIHEHGLVHRDIKPANLFLEGAARRVKILDFGLARAVSGDARLTVDGTIVGSPAFMAPEQAGRKPVDARADLFSLGGVMYYLATGVPAFQGAEVLAVLLAVASSQPPPPCECRPELPQPLSDLVMHLLAKDPADRPASAAAVLDRLGQIRGTL